MYSESWNVQSCSVVAGLGSIMLVLVQVFVDEIRYEGI
jgi:hypothetical protein